MKKRYWSLGIATLASILSLPGLVGKFPDPWHSIKNIPGKYGIGFLVSDPRYAVVNNEVEGNKIPPLNKMSAEDERNTLASRIGSLFITRSSNFGEIYPGGILLSKNETERGNLFGRYTSYDPERAQKNVGSIQHRAAMAKKRVLIYDEGEGGYVSGIGVLPAARDIGNYYSNNVIGETVKGYLTPSSSKEVRSKQVNGLFEDYAKELKARGVDAVFGPVVDVVNKSKEGNLMARSDRNFSDKHSETREIVQLYISAMHDNGIKVNAKHFLSAGLAEEGDIHFEEVPNPRRLPERRWAGYTYRQFRND